MPFGRDRTLIHEQTVAIDVMVYGGIVKKMSQLSIDSGVEMSGHYSSRSSNNYQILIVTDVRG